MFKRKQYLINEEPLGRHREKGTKKKFWFRQAILKSTGQMKIFYLKHNKPVYVPFPEFIMNYDTLELTGVREAVKKALNYQRKKRDIEYGLEVVLMARYEFPMSVKTVVSDNSLKIGAFSSEKEFTLDPNTATSLSLGLHGRLPLTMRMPSFHSFNPFSSKTDSMRIQIAALCLKNWSVLEPIFIEAILKQKANDYKNNKNAENN